jgi:DUF4097 and DUF4098 domain-containing protein YvlB
MTKARKHPRFWTLLVAVFLLPSVMTSAQEKKEFTYTVGPQAVISISNNYGPITVKPSRNRQVVVTTVSYSDAVSFENEQYGNRIKLQSVSTRHGNGLADYIVRVPADAVVSLRSSDGSLRARGLRGDVILQADTATVEVSDISDAHLHVRTLSGPINLTDIRNSHLDVQSVSGDVNIHNVTGSFAEVHSGRGRIKYEGDPGPAGEYQFTSHSGDLEVSIPTSASVEIKSHSRNGESNEELPKNDGALTMSSRNLFLKPRITNASRFVLRSFKGKIHIKRP